MLSASGAQCGGYRGFEQISLTDEQAGIAQAIDSEFHRLSRNGPSCPYLPFAIPSGSAQLGGLPTFANLVASG
jgi:hypothetical protein